MHLAALHAPSVYVGVISTSTCSEHACVIRMSDVSIHVVYDVSQHYASFYDRGCDGMVTVWGRCMGS